ncbi:MULTISPECIES: acyl carrier protein [Actinomycetospora]|jgi:acyl carrier protein|uniref:Acyl carrier protein n=1 Tax=Actinomycetospora chibensis TaxID=663606 RepID=A0ABV9RJM0_9PSEU|nr:MULTISPECIES: acyl carrier protein [Actinomycetospora]MDD7916627.1 acyl carrier protein [Actinomycetospora callitridis]MDD7926869.1 acyl carrier protein [Actinomycetospora chibensis]
MPDASTGAVNDQLIDLVRDRLGVEVPSSDTDLVADGLIDSLALVTLIVGIEDTFGCRLPLDDFDIERFRSVDAMAAFLAEVGVTG